LSFTFKFLLNFLLDFLKRGLNWLFSIDNNSFVLFKVVVDHRLSLIIICTKPFSDDFNFIINPSAGFPSVKQPLRHAFLSAMQHNDERNNYVWMHIEVPPSEILVVSRETIYQKFAPLKPLSIHLGL